MNDHSNITHGKSYFFISYSINALLLIFSGALIGVMWFHHMHVKVLFNDVTMPPGLNLFLNPYVRIIYALGVIFLIGKESLIKKPITYRMKVNATAAMVLMIIEIIQWMVVWYYAFGRYSS